MSRILIPLIVLLSIINGCTADDSAISELVDFIDSVSINSDVLEEIESHWLGT